jgi:photosystem II stability/assembly factor-like uncharacterized protein
LALSNVLEEPSGTSTGPSTVVVDATDDGGLAWKAEKAPVADPTDLADIACPDRLDCMAVGTTDDNGALMGVVLVTSDGGRSWKSLGAPAGSSGLSAVQCDTGNVCLVLATDGTAYWSASTADGGRVWQRGGTLPAGFSGPSNVTCSGPQTCMTAGYTPATPGKGAGAIAVTEDGGGTWAAATVPQGVGLLHAIACSAAHCIAVGTTSTTLTDVAQGHGEMLASTDVGSTWTAAVAPAGVDDAFDISCPSATRCATVGTKWTAATPVGGVVTTVNGGVTWHSPESRYVPVGLAGVDCPTAVSCVAAGNDVLARIALPAATHRTAYGRAAAARTPARRSGEGSASKASSLRITGRA